MAACSAGAQFPLGPRIRDRKPGPLRIPLRLAPHLRHHHRQIAPVLRSIPHPRRHERRLQPTVPPLGHCCRPGEERHTLMQEQRARRASDPVRFRDEAHVLRARTHERPRFLQELRELGMPMRPPAHIHVRPDRHLLGTRHSHGDAAIVPATRLNATK